MKGLSGNYTNAGTITNVVITFGGTQPNSTYKVMLNPNNNVSAATNYVSAKTTTTFFTSLLSILLTFVCNVESK